MHPCFMKKQMSILIHSMHLMFVILQVRSESTDDLFPPLEPAFLMDP